jgi:hypothetical protein
MAIRLQGAMGTIHPWNRRDCRGEVPDPVSTNLTFRIADSTVRRLLYRRTCSSLFRIVLLPGYMEKENDPLWHRRYKAAMLETDPAKLRNRVEAAEAAIRTRLKAISDSPGHDEELRAIDGAVRSLGVLKRELERGTEP